MCNRRQVWPLMAHGSAPHRAPRQARSEGGGGKNRAGEIWVSTPPLAVFSFLHVHSVSHTRCAIRDLSHTLEGLMGRPILHVRVDQEVLDRIDGCCGDASRSDWVRGLIDRALDGGGEPKRFDAAPVGVVGEAPSPQRQKKPVPEVPAGSKMAERARLMASREPENVPKARPSSRVNPFSTRDADKVALMDYFRAHPRRSSRQAKEALGWLGLRYENAERGLLDDGKIWFVNGLIEVLDD